jgi:hypothetical protein
LQGACVRGHQTVIPEDLGGGDPLHLAYAGGAIRHLRAADGVLILGLRCAVTSLLLNFVELAFCELRLLGILGSS